VRRKSPREQRLLGTERVRSNSSTTYEFEYELKIRVHAMTQSSTYISRTFGALGENCLGDWMPLRAHYNLSIKLT
jgi:hypothetical protein